LGRARTVAQVSRHVGEDDAAGTSPLDERVAVALSESDEWCAIEALPRSSTSSTCPDRRRETTTAAVAPWPPPRRITCQGLSVVHRAGHAFGT
jgi:hypothetical protein